MLGSTARAMRSAAPFSICRRCASSLVLGEFDAKGAVSGATRAAVTAAGKVGGPIHVLLAGAGAKGASASASQVAGVERVFYSEDASVSNGLAEGLSALLLSLQAKSSAFAFLPFLPPFFCGASFRSQRTCTHAALLKILPTTGP